MDIIDLGNQDIKKLFSVFFREKLNEIGLTKEQFASKVGCDLKTVQRYMAFDRADCDWIPATLPQRTYLDFLSAFNSKHEDFRQFVQQASQTHNNIASNSHNASTENHSTGQGASRIGTLNIHSGAHLNQSPIGASVVTYGNINNSK